ncbi:hypothetical protein [Thermogemmatispora sp.]|uniref:hypothetical protein n=1 Tax=Thermogemmatispora sp. TaxID=1968838 RepID=UPI0035E446EC
MGSQTKRLLLLLVAVAGDVRAFFEYDKDDEDDLLMVWIGGSLSGMLPFLAEGGYVIDFTVLADHPWLVRWANEAPVFGGWLEERPGDAQAGPSGEVGAAFLARYWMERGARVGWRQGDELRWSDGSVKLIGR